MNEEFEVYEAQEWAAAMETEPNDDHNPDPNTRPWWMMPLPTKIKTNENTKTNL
jgi:hypothetical protein